MISTDTTVRTLKAVAMAVGISVFLWSTGLPTLFHAVEAASITSASDVLSNSAPSASSVHTITFSTPNGMAAGETFEVAFHADFDSASLVIGDVSATVNGSASSTAAAAGANTFGVDGLGTDTLEFTAGTGGVASSSVLVLTIGDEAGTMIANPAVTTSYEIIIGGGASTMQDSGQVRVAIIDQVTVSASVDASLTFVVSGVASGATVNGSPTTTVAETTNTTLPFGSLTIGQSETLAHDLVVTTNAVSGFSVTVEQTGALESSTGATIDGFIDGSNTVTPTAWQSPGAVIPDDLTYGHWGVTSDDGTTTRAAEFTSDTWVSGSTTPIVIMGHDGVSDGLVSGEGATRVGYQVEISGLQEAGDDYTTSLRYIATPTF
jgi:hypothetical protein